jgi:DNA repair exonuclease SbcCD ATPase subunit
VRMKVILKICATAVLSLGQLPAWAEAPTETLSALEQADDLRERDALEERTWRAQADGLEAVVRTVEAEIQAVQAQIRERKVENERRAPRKQEAEQRVQENAQLDFQLREAASAIHSALDALSPLVLPGVVAVRSPSEKNTEEDAEAELQAAKTRLETTEQGLRNREVLYERGEQDAEERAVELLRIGGALAWWRGYDGSDVGIAYLVDKSHKLQLEIVQDTELQTNIRSAFEIAKGRAPAHIVWLPVRARAPLENHR